MPSRAPRLTAFAVVASFVTIVVGAASYAPANPGYRDAFYFKYEFTGQTTIMEDISNITGRSCNVCHNTAVFFGDWDCYRRDLIRRLRAGRTIEEALVDIETWDSDGDGVSNIEEITRPRGNGQIGYSPGLIGPQGTDPCLTEMVGDVPGSTVANTFRLETPPAPATGACCRGATCTVGTAAACTGSNTHYAGDNTACNAAGNLVTPCCRADFDQNRSVEVADIFAFLSGWFGSSATADFDGNNLVEVADIFGFLSAWFSGC